jgi:hypothetical protein
MNSLMRYFLYLFSVIFLFGNSNPCVAATREISSAAGPGGEDTIDIQILNNGKAWRNLYYRIKGDQFLFSPEFLPGNVTIEGRKFNNLKIKYDIYADELIMITDHGIIIQLNKEMVDFFSMDFNNNIYYFKRLEADSVNTLSGYINVLYEGSTSLYVKYRKEILLLAVENKYDLFYQSNKVFVKKGDEIFKVDSKTEFLKLFKDQKQQLHSFIKSNKIKLSKKIPESFKPVVEYYDKLRH